MVTLVYAIWCCHCWCQFTIQRQRNEDISHLCVIFKLFHTGWCLISKCQQNLTQWHTSYKSNDSNCKAHETWPINDGSCVRALHMLQWLTTNPRAEYKDVKLLQQNWLIWEHKLHQVDDGCTQTDTLRHSLTAAPSCCCCCCCCTIMSLLLTKVLVPSTVIGLHSVLAADYCDRWS